MAELREALQLSTLQSERDIWVAYNFPGQDMPHSLLGAVEEIGELSHHYLKMTQGIRGDEAMHREEMADAVGDVIVYLAGVATFLGLDYGELVQGVWDKVKQRDWINDPERGGE